VSAADAHVGFDVSPVDVLILNSPRPHTAAALFRERIFVIAVNPLLTVMLVVLLTSLPPARKYSRLAEDRPLNATDPKPFAASSTLAIGLVVPLVNTMLVPADLVNHQDVAQRSVMELANVNVRLVLSGTVPVASNSHSAVVMPLLANPSPLVYSPSFVHVPVPPDALTTSL
jgi:hypothetical protein